MLAGWLQVDPALLGKADPALLGRRAQPLPYRLPRVPTQNSVGGGRGPAGGLRAPGRLASTSGQSVEQPLSREQPQQQRRIVDAPNAAQAALLQGCYRARCRSRATPRLLRQATT